MQFKKFYVLASIYEHIFWIHNQKLIRLGGKLKCGFVPSLDKYIDCRFL